ncbi:MAG: hypothetical protein F4X56_00210 [Gammaproteobacteria bacterium]|nr:hypothetical protein [Gammaproteobacteria bacterium]MYC24321.1 hypothetical protein [Gammaproteobacteria bacterium]
MNSIKLLVLMVIATVFVISLGAHPGPERHPIEQELFDLEAELRAEFNGLESRLNTRLDNLSAPDDAAIAVVVESTVTEALVGITQTTNELNNQLEEVVSSNRQLMYYGIGAFAVLFAGFIGMFSYFQAKQKALK